MAKRNKTSFNFWYLLLIPAVYVALVVAKVIKPRFIREGRAIYEVSPITFQKTWLKDPATVDRRLIDVYGKADWSVIKEK